MAIRIVTDSTADIPREQAQALGIAILPLTVFFGDEAYLDGVDLDSEGFYQKLQASKDLPRTSQPSPAAFQEVYKQLIEEGADAIISVHLSAKLSGTYQSACTARDSLPAELQKTPIEIIDSKTVSMAMGMPIMRAEEEARRGDGLEEIKARLVDRLSRASVLAILDTLEYVRRGGRIGGASAFLGNMLSFKPIIAVKDGEVIAVERPRTRGKAYERIAQLVSERGKVEQIAIIESSEEVGLQLAEAMKTTYAGDIPRYKLGAVVGTHTGPGTAGVVFITEK